MSAVSPTSPTSNTNVEEHVPGIFTVGKANSVDDGILNGMHHSARIRSNTVGSTQLRLLLVLFMMQRVLRSFDIRPQIDSYFLKRTPLGGFCTLCCFLFLFLVSILACILSIILGCTVIMMRSVLRLPPYSYF